MKRIGIFLSAFPSQGGMFQYSQTVLDALCRLPQSGFSLVAAYTNDIWQQYLTGTQIVPLRLGSGTVLRALASASLVVRFPIENWWHWTERWSDISKRVMAQKCDLWVFPRQDIWSSLFQVPTLVTVHDLMHRYEAQFPEVGSCGRAMYRDSYIRRSCELSRAVIVDSNLGKMHVHDSYNVALEKIFALPYAPRRFPSSNGEETVSDSLSSLLSGKFLFYPAQFWEHKNHIRLVKAVAHVKRRFPDVKLCLAGAKTGRYYEIAELVTRLDLQQNVRFLGYVPDSVIPTIYRKARALIFPTFFGPTNVPPLEAMVLGCPVATSKIYAMPERLGNAALYFDPSSVDQIADCIETLWLDDKLCSRLSNEGKLYSQMWTADHFQDALHDIIYRVTAPSSIAEPTLQFVLN
jgi:glycosyltransferase involved in cell wall biosynthesis